MKACETARKTAGKIIEKFGTADVFAIAAKAGVHVIYESWHPVTIGEFDKRRKTIVVNRRAAENGKFTEREIIAHELGHFFAAEFNLDRKAEEAFAEAFAATFAETFAHVSA